MTLDSSMHIAFVLPGLHRVNRGAETAFEALGRELAAFPNTKVTLIGSGEARPDVPYTYLQGSCIPREKFRKWPSLPALRNEYRYEELSFIKSLWKTYDPAAFDAVLTCSYPFAQWALRLKKKGGKRPAQIFVTENGDWPAQRKNMEYRLFNCDGLVCTNPEYYNRHKDTFECALIPNGIDVDAFSPESKGEADLDLPESSPRFLMVSALIGSKYPVEGIRAVAQIPGAGLVVAGNGPLHEECDAVGKELLGDRYKRITLPLEQMPQLYRSCDVLLHLSRAEAFGNIYIEAAACGLPVVGHATENTQWILDDMGILVDTGNEEDLVEALTQAVVLKKKINVEERYRRMADRFSWTVIAGQYHRFISQIVSTSKDSKTYE